MRVGVVLGEFVPQDGGGFTFVSEIVSALGLLDPERQGLELTIFCDARAVSFVRENTCYRFEVVPVPASGAVDRLCQRLQEWIPLAKRLIGRKSRLEQTLQDKSIAFAWFVAGSGEVIDIPYAATVWDLQHRTHPWFPEVSSGSTWDGREVVFATYLRRASIVITGTLTGKAQLERYYQVDGERISILPHPTPQFALNARSEPLAALPAGLQPQRFFFYPAQYWAHKNHATLLKAFAQYCKLAPDGESLVFVGSDKGNKAYLQGMATKLGLGDRVKFLGFVSREELIELYRQAKALVYPSFSGPENLPPLEAFALGCPVLNADFPGAKEQLGDAARYFDPLLPESMLEALQDIVAQPALRRELVSRGAQRAQAWRCPDFVAAALGLIGRFKAIRECWA